MIHLLNAATFPLPGKYAVKEILKDTFIQLIKLKTSEIKSWIGYEDVQNHIKEISGIEFPIDKRKTMIKDGDNMLICHLKTRTVPKDTAKDYEYLYVVFVSFKDEKKGE